MFPSKRDDFSQGVLYTPTLFTPLMHSDSVDWESLAVHSLDILSIEAGLVSTRMLLVFLGIKLKEGRIESISNRKPDDIGIEHIYHNGLALRVVPLDLLNSAVQLPCLDGKKRDASQVVAQTISDAHKLSAHFTKRSALSGEVWYETSVITSVLIEKFLYERLGADVPPFDVWTKRKLPPEFLQLHHDKVEDIRRIL